MNKHQKYKTSVILSAGSIFLAVLISTTVVALLSFYLLHYILKPQGILGLIGATLLSATLICFLLGTIWVVLRRNTKNVLIITRKSSAALIPLVVGATYLILLFLSNNVSNSKLAENADSKYGVGLSGVLSGNEGYVSNPDLEESKLYELTNEMRKIDGKSLLNLNPKLSQSATNKCNDMVKKDYWSHIDPAGNEPWVFFDNAGYDYEKAGENLASNYITNKAVVDGWMNSPSHRANLLTDEYVDVGFGICQSDNFVGKGKQFVIVQHFGLAQSSSSSQSEPGQSHIPPNNLAPTIEYKPYVPGICTKTPIPYKTKYIDDPYRDIGSEFEIGGYDGYVESCSADSTGYKRADFTWSPIDKTIYRGTRISPSSIPTILGN